jgi:small conductance mechanosensitive channel
VVFIPNSVVAVEPTINYSVAADRRINLTIAVAYQADVGRAKEIIHRVLDREEGLSMGRSKTVLATDVREYAVDIGVYCYAPPDSWLEVASDLRQKLVTALQEGGIELAVPTRKYLNPVPVDTETEQDSQTNPS